MQVRESRIVDMVGQLNRARSQGVSAAERSALLDSITAEAGRVRSGREAETTASVLGKVGLPICCLPLAAFLRASPQLLAFRSLQSPPVIQVCTGCDTQP